MKRLRITSWTLLIELALSHFLGHPVFGDLRQTEKKRNLSDIAQKVAHHIWRQSYERNFVEKQTKLGLNSLDGALPQY